MKKQIIKAYIRKLYILKLIPTFIFFIICLYLWKNMHFANIISPPVVSNAIQLNEAVQSKNYYIRLSVPTLYYSGYDCISDYGICGSYYYAYIDDTCVFILVSNETSNNRTQKLNDVSINAKIKNDTAASDYLINHFADDINWTVSGMKSISASYIISEPDYKSLSLHILLLLLLSAGIYALIYMLICIFYFLQPQFSSVLRHLGLPKKALQALEQANYELKNLRLFYCADISITSHYFIELNKTSVSIIPLNEIIWVYKHSYLQHFAIKNRHLRYTLCIHTKHKTFYCHNKEKEDADKVLSYFESSHPDILIGYSPENKHIAYSKK